MGKMWQLAYAEVWSLTVTLPLSVCRHLPAVATGAPRWYMCRWWPTILPPVKISRTSITNPGSHWNISLTTYLLSASSSSPMKNSWMNRCTHSLLSVRHNVILLSTPKVFFICMVKVYDSFKANSNYFLLHIYETRSCLYWSSMCGKIPKTNMYLATNYSIQKWTHFC